MTVRIFGFERISIATIVVLVVGALAMPISQALEDNSAEMPQSDLSSLDGVYSTEGGLDAEVSDNNPRDMRDENGSRLFIGEPDDEQSVIGNRVAELIYQFPDTFAGAAFYSDYSGIEVFRKMGSERGVQELEALIRENSAETYVDIVEVRHSWAELESASDSFASVAESIPAVSSFGPDELANAVSVTVDLSGEEAVSSVPEIERQIGRNFSRTPGFQSVPIVINDGVDVSLADSTRRCQLVVATLLSRSFWKISRGV